MDVIKAIEEATAAIRKAYILLPHVTGQSDTFPAYMAIEAQKLKKLATIVETPTNPLSEAAIDHYTALAPQALKLQSDIRM